MNIMQKLCLSGAIGVSVAMTAMADDNTRGIGRYPGNPAENFAPMLRETDVITNLALRRPVRASSSFDFCLTPQLVTDGIVSRSAVPTLFVSTPDGLLPRREREWAIDGGMYSRNTVYGADTYLNYEWTGALFRADSVRLRLNVAYDPKLADGKYAIRVLASDGTGKARKWHAVATMEGQSLPGKQSRYVEHSDPNKQTEREMLPTRDVVVTLPVDGGFSFSGLRLQLTMKGAAHWTVFEFMPCLEGRSLTSQLLTAARFGSAWMSDGGGNQWVEVDLGRPQPVERVELNWIEKALEGRVEMSDDGKNWTVVAALPGGKNVVDKIKTKGANGRYVRIGMTRPTSSGRYVLSEMNVIGRGGYEVVPHVAAGMDGNRLPLHGGDWLLKRAEATDKGENISSSKTEGDGWIMATVPGTALMSYVNIGALPDPNVADNLENASESFFNSNFWYRRTFSVPEKMKGKHVFLCFDGINWKANVFLNGKRVNRIEGAFMRSRTDITEMLREGTNVLAVEVIKPDNIGGTKEKTYATTDINGGMLGADNPTFHASIGWDWISSVRGRETGIWNDVFLSAEGSVTISDPLVSTSLALPDTAATITPRVILTNNEAGAVSGKLRGWIGGIAFEKRVDMAQGEEKEVVFAPEEYAQLREQRMRLWWPNGYGEPYMYDAGYEFVPDGGEKVKTDYRAGIRQMTYEGADKKLQMWINGKRFVPLGGNWGFSEHNLLYRKREYDITVGYHRQMNFNMIRNWVGQIGDEEFYDACDRNGIMVWQDFWLANPCDGPDPDDNALFMHNASDFTRRMRRHPSIALYCGRNEGYPPAALNASLKNLVDDANPGMLYIPSSADEGVSGHGPYWAEPAKTYFSKQTGKLHTERGMPNVMTYEGLARTFSPEALWPQSEEWGRHDFTQRGAQRGATFNAMMERAFGKPADAREFGSLAQWINYDGYRAMFESGAKYRQGLLIWMSHSCWPSQVWQCYDYWMEPTAAFFACRKACEPLHIQWNALTRDVEVVNITADAHKDMKARRDILDVRGRVVSSAETSLFCDADTTLALSSLHVDSLAGGQPTDVRFIRLALDDAEGRRVSDNFYVIGNEEGNLMQLRSLPKVSLKTDVVRDGNRYDVTIANETDTPAMMIRLNLKAEDGEQVLPVSYEDNYFHLMPGEKRTVRVEWSPADTRSLPTYVEITGFNVK